MKHTGEAGLMRLHSPVVHVVQSQVRKRGQVSLYSMKRTKKQQTVTGAAKLSLRRVASPPTELPALARGGYEMCRCASCW